MISPSTFEVSIFESSRFVAGISQETSGLGIEPDADPPLAELEEESLLPFEQALNPRVLTMARATTPAAIFFLQHAKPPLVRVVDRYEYRITNYLVLVDKPRLPSPARLHVA